MCVLCVVCCVCARVCACVRAAVLGVGGRSGQATGARTKCACSRASGRTSCHVDGPAAPLRVPRRARGVASPSSPLYRASSSSVIKSTSSSSAERPASRERRAAGHAIGAAILRPLLRCSSAALATITAAQAARATAAQSDVHYVGQLTPHVYTYWTLPVANILHWRFAGHSDRSTVHPVRYKMSITCTL